MKSWLIFHAFYDIGQDPEEFILQLFPSSDKKQRIPLWKRKKTQHIFFFFIPFWLSNAQSNEYWYKHEIKLIN